MTNAQIMDLYERSAKPMSVDVMLNIARASEVVKLEEKITSAIVGVVPIIKYVPWVMDEMQRKRALIRSEFEKLVAPYRVTEGTEGTKVIEGYYSKGGAP